MKSLLAGLLGICAISTAFAAETWGPPTGHTIANIRAYPDGSFVFQFQPSLTAGCQFNDHSVTSLTSTSFKLISALATSAFHTDTRVQLIYDGCSANGGVNVTGVILHK